MKKLLVIGFMLFNSICWSQNINDAYGDNEWQVWWPYGQSVQYFEGEYQILLDNLFWAADEDLKEVAISFSIEAVSFPFIPKGFKPDSSDNLNKEYQERHLNTEIASGGYNYGYVSQTSGNNGATGHEGRGWVYGDYNIYQKVYNTNICEQNLLRSCNGDFMLLSVVFTDPVPAEWACILPHTILKHSLYFHCGPFITDPVVDTISWLYDNTRGEMRRYPFINSTSSNSGNSQETSKKGAHWVPFFISDNKTISFHCTRLHRTANLTTLSRLSCAGIYNLYSKLIRPQILLICKDAFLSGLC